MWLIIMCTTISMKVVHRNSICETRTITAKRCKPRSRQVQRANAVTLCELTKPVQLTVHDKHTYRDQWVLLQGELANSAVVHETRQEDQEGQEVQRRLVERAAATVHFHEHCAR
jgi:hypothetical protein